MFGWLKNRKTTAGQAAGSSAAGETPAATIAPSYWLEVCQGREAALAYLRASGDAVLEALEQYPILQHPQFPDAILAMGRASGEQRLAAACTKSAAALSYAQKTLREQLASSYGGMMGRLAMALAQEETGDRRRNLEQSIECFRAAGLAFGSGPGLGEGLFNEANVWWSLANLGEDVRGHMERAVERYGAARAAFGEGAQAAECAFGEAQARTSLADHGFDAAANLARAAELYEEAHGGLRHTPKGTACILGMARAKGRLEALG